MEYKDIRWVPTVASGLKMRLLQPWHLPSGNESFSKVNTHGEVKNPIVAFLFNIVCQAVTEYRPG